MALGGSVPYRDRQRFFRCSTLNAESVVSSRPSRSGSVKDEDLFAGSFSSGSFDQLLRVFGATFSLCVGAIVFFMRFLPLLWAYTHIALFAAQSHSHASAGIL